MQAALLGSSVSLGGARLAIPARATSRAGPSNLVVEAAGRSTRRDRVQGRHKRIRNKVSGDPERPRLAVFRSNNHIYAQVIDDTAGNTLAAVSTLSPAIREKLGGGNGGNKEAAELVGKQIAELCIASKIDKVAFDRGGNVYHGRVKALADAAREGGLQF